MALPLTEVVMADTRDWLRGLGFMSDADWTYWEARAQRQRSERADDVDAGHSAAIDNLALQVRKLQVTVEVLMQTLAETGAFDTKRLEEKLKRAGIRGPAARVGMPTHATPAEAEPLVCADCGVEVKVANSFLRDGVRVCEGCY
jgi:hypothetical protein